MGRNEPITLDLLPGTLDMLVLKVLARSPLHGWGIAQHINQVSGDIFDVGVGSLYPALQRLLVNGWVKAEWGVSENNRRARYYTLTAAGRRRLEVEVSNFDRMLLAITRVMQTT